MLIRFNRTACSCLVFSSVFRFPIDDWQPRANQFKDEQLWDKDWDDNSLDDPLGQQIRQLAQHIVAQQQQQQQQQQQHQNQ